ncbi:MAG: helix-turn-helix domain-containing protein, partial [Defluviitaleaceae bacterium]|nr:helix-turn-helix domain-containing protein [Defluviitaleaceae bacterium]
DFTMENMENYPFIRGGAILSAKALALIDTILLSFEIGDRVKALREANNMSVKDLAEQMRIRAVHLKMIESGGRGITAYNFLKLHEIFGVSIQYIVTGKEFEAEQSD